MSLSKDFKDFCSKIKLDNRRDMEKTTENIAQKLNSHYYEVDGDRTSHMYIVGSVGRKTAIAGSSDLDLLFDLPDSIYNQYDNYDSNGQSALIQDVKNVLIEKYPNTDIRGDGQVVVINFNKYTVQLVPGFKQSDDKFKYPDTHDAGSWKITDPLSEQLGCEECNIDSNGIYYDFCHILRCWKKTIGFKMGGLLIDTLVYNYFEKNDWFSNSESGDYLQILIDLFKFLKSQDPDKNYWLAVGSNQQVYNSDNGAFVNKAKKAYKKLEEKEDSASDVNDTLRELLGNDFPEGEKNENSVQKNLIRSKQKVSTEQFIEDLVQLDIRYYLQIECRVTQNGWRPFLLTEFLRRDHNKVLRHNKKLDFYVAYTDCIKPYKIWWKVRNVGDVAEQKNMIRGKILKTNDNHQKEHTDFRGPHYVECYLIKNNVCVAWDRIDVPIGDF